MIGKKKSRMRLGRVVFGLFFAVAALLGMVGPMADSVYADPADESSETEGGGSTGLTGDGCQSSLGAIGWLVCPTTGAIAQGVDFLYGLIKDFLVIDPVEMESGSPIYEIWKYFRGLTNVVFIIFLLVVIYSQITGWGISNYGVKKSLPKLIVAAVLVNLSFLLCSLAVDASNVIGGSLRGLFDTIANSAVVADGGTTAAEMDLKNAELFSAMAGGTALTIAGATVAFETGAVWMMIPLLLGAIVAVVTGLITIALRQAVVALLIMISPLAVVAYMLPNTENLFKQWKKLLTQMLVFYPAFSLLFGASNLAGFAIILSSKDGFGVMLGIAVQIFPLFFSWKLMQMSGTFLGTVNAKMQSLATRPLAGNRAWADSRRMATKQRRLAEGRPTTPSLRLMQFMSNRRVARDAETAENADLVKKRGLAYRASRNYNRKGAPTKQGEEAYESIRRGLEYQNVITRDENNMNKGLGQLAAVTSMEAQAATTAEKAKARAKKARLDELDAKMVVASDTLKFEQARGEKITADNAEGFYKRAEAAIGVHMDEKYGYTTDRAGNRVARSDYKFNLASGSSEAAEAATRYDTMSKVMEGDVVGTHFAAANAAHAYDTQNKIVSNKFQKYFDLAPPTKEVLGRVQELSTYAKRNDDGTFAVKATDNIDAIVAGMRVLNQRGDTDLVKKVVDDLTNEEYGGLELGTHASQSLASFLMFEVSNKDPYLRRFGKYINLETARVYNGNDRKVTNVNYDEYVKGYHEGEPDLISAENPTGRMYAKKGMATLMEGTSFDGIERTALDSYDKSLRGVYTDENGVLDLAAYQAKRTEVDKAVGPQFISANMKFLSGSEQIISSVKAKTGFSAKQDKETGEYTMVPIWDDEDEMKKMFNGYTPEEKAAAKDELKKWYREQTLGYLKDHTATQVLGLRSDYHDGLREHLADAFLLRDEEDLDEEQLEALNEYKREEAEIQTMYGDEPIGEAKRKRDAAKKEAREKIAGVEFRKRLDKNGILQQIYRTRRSGAANAAKPFVRDWLKLDDENSIRDYEDERRPKRGKNKKQKEIEEDSGAYRPTSGSNDGNYSVYDEDKRREFRDDIEDLYQDMKNTDDEDFYEESLNYITGVLSEESFIVQDYERLHREDPYISKHDLKEYLLGLLDNPENY